MIPNSIALTAVLNMYWSKNPSIFFKTKLFKSLTILYNIINVIKTLIDKYTISLSKLNFWRNFAPDLTASFIGLLAWSTSMLSIFPNIFNANHSDVLCSGWKSISIGKTIITAKILKKSWTVEAAKALLNSVPLFMCPTDTIVFVTVVPMFAPIIIGIELAIVRLPLLTIPTIKDVVVDELWKSTVAKIPMNNAIKGSLVVVNTVSAKSEPIRFIADDIPAIPTKKR